MHQQSWSAFFNMGGYAFFVWFSFGLTALCMAWEVVMVQKRIQQALHFARLFTQEKSWH